MKQGVIFSHLGQTLIVVLIILLMMMALGTVAVRQALMSLKVANQSQIQAHLLQSADAYFFKLEAASQLEKVLNVSKFGPIGYAAQAENIGNEMAFCVSSESAHAFRVNSVGRFNTRIASGQFVGLSKGYCDPEHANNHFGDGAQAVMTQVAIKVENNADSALAQWIPSSDPEIVEQPLRVRIHVVAILPAMAKLSSATITRCLQHFPAEAIAGSATIADCLKNNNIPFNTQVAEYKYSDIAI